MFSKLSVILSPKNRLVTLILVTTLLKGLIWSASIPLWHASDEAAHFAQVEFFAEFDKMPKGNIKDKSKEIVLSERLLGTERDEKGNNKFTYHPEFRIDYSNNFTGLKEEEINNFPKSYRKDLVKTESTRYPPFFYIIGGYFYRLFYNFDLISRVYVVRLVSIFSLVLMTFIAYKIGLMIFKDKISSLSLAVLVSFQPMNTFVSSGVTSDSLGNLLFIIIIYFCLKIMFFKQNVKDTIMLSVSIGLAMYTKPQALVALSFVIFAYTFALFSKKIRFKQFYYLIPLFLLFLYFSGGHIVVLKMFENWKFNNNPLPYIETKTIGESAYMTFPNFLIWTIKHTISEVFPWYWGVFDWLGVVLPKIVNQIIVRLTLISVFGLLIYFLKIIKKRQFSANFFPVIFMLFTSIMFFLAITVMDYAHFKSHNFSLGIQGRYFFPTIVPHMALLLLGFQEIFAIVKKRILASKIIAILMIILNFIGLKTLINAYYDSSSIESLLLQISQYKPEIFKGFSLILIFFIYLLLLFIFLLKFCRVQSENSKTS